MGLSEKDNTNNEGTRMGDDAHRNEVIGRSVSRLDVLEKVTGQARYCGDVNFGMQLYAKTVYSTHPRAKIKSIDTSRAEALEGVAAIITAKDVPYSNEMFGKYPVLAEKEVKYIGDGVAVVAAESLATARKAAQRIRVEYEPVEGVYTLEDAIKPDAPKVHEDQETNVIDHTTHKLYYGDVKKGFEEADTIIERTYKTQFVDQVYIEPEAVIAQPDPYRVGVEIHGSTQNPYTVQQNVAGVLGFKQSQVRVIQSVLGGSFGGKDESVMMMAARCSILALKTKRPVKMVLTREESILESAKRHPYLCKYKMGVKKDGTITAIEDTIYVQGGAYNNKSMFTNWRGSIHAAGPYRVPHVKTDIMSFYTNTIYGGAYRGFSAPQIVFATESLMDEAAAQLNMDPKDFRLKNCLRPNDTLPTGQVLDPKKMPAPLERMINDVVKRSDYDKKRVEFKTHNEAGGPVKKGIGIAATFRGTGLGGEGIDTSGAVVTIHGDGSVNIQSSFIEMGQGMRTSHAQVAAEVLGISYARCTFSTSDTSMVMDGGPTVASRGLLAGGKAVEDAALKLRKRLAGVAALHLQVDEEDIDSKQDRFFYTGDPEKHIGFDELIQIATKGMGLSLSAQGWHNPGPEPLDPETGQGNAYPSYIFGAVVPEVSVDIETGKVKMEKVTMAYEVGRAINPKIIEGQIYGGFLQGLGMGLMEDVEEKDGLLRTFNYEDYMVPTAADMPVFDLKLFESDPNVGPFGAKGIGEVGVELGPVSVANAVFHATGTRIRELPVNLERVLLGRALVK
ncbi:MAG: xanthine dehydrogenase family protein molybdopterin-binding subunit [Spirochaetia bacterium]